MTRGGTIGGRRGDGEAGVVLVIVMLVVLGLSVVGAIIIESTRMDTATAGNVRQATQSAYVSEVGTSVALRVFAAAYSGYKRQMTQDRRQTQRFFRSSFDTGVAGVPPTLDPGVSMSDPGSLAGYGMMIPDYAVLIDRPYEYGDSPGFSVSGTQGVSFCFRRYTFTTTGQVDYDVLTDSLPARTESRATMRATSVIGPTDCTL